jgi:hypothetical protein
MRSRSGRSSENGIAENVSALSGDRNRLKTIPADPETTASVQSLRCPPALGLAVRNKTPGLRCPRGAYGSGLFPWRCRASPGSAGERANHARPSKRGKNCPDAGIAHLAILCTERTLLDFETIPMAGVPGRLDSVRAFLHQRRYGPSAVSRPNRPVARLSRGLAHDRICLGSSRSIRLVARWTLSHRAKNMVA